jgi:hypothetical protein
MPKRGRPIRLVNGCAEFWPIARLSDLPEMRGIYILYDKHYVPLYCGRSGKGMSDVRSRINGEKSKPYYGHKIAYFSVYELDPGYHQQIETLILRALGHTLKWNKNKGNFLKGCREMYPQSIDELASGRFLTRLYKKQMISKLMP